MRTNEKQMTRALSNSGRVQGAGNTCGKDGRLASVVIAVMKGASPFPIELAQLAPSKPPCRTQGASRRTGRAMSFNIYMVSQKNVTTTNSKRVCSCSQVKWILFYNKSSRARFSHSFVLHLPRSPTTRFLYIYLVPHLHTGSPRLHSSLIGHKHVCPADCHRISTSIRHHVFCFLLHFILSWRHGFTPKDASSRI